MLFPSVAAIMQEWLPALNAYAAPSYRDRQQCGFQMFLGACDVGEAQPSSLRSEGGQMFVHSADVSVIIRCLFRENCAITIAFFIVLILVSFLFVRLWCLHVQFFFKGTLASRVIIDDVFHIPDFPPGSAISLSLETQLPSLFSEVTSSHIHPHPHSCTPAPFLLP